MGTAADFPVTIFVRQSTRYRHGPNHHKNIIPLRVMKSPHRRTTAHSFVFLLLAGMVLLVGGSGCSRRPGPELASVKGIVLLDGKPLPNASLLFQPSGEFASPSYGVTGKDGRFELSFNRYKKGAMPGEHEVSLSTAGLVVATDGKETYQDESLPARYHRDSKLTYVVKANEHNFFEIKLTSEKDPKPSKTGRKTSR
ncbi:hypothetical protein SH661x_002576 [Planctomicrobium sp. SH661]|uniref:hypothetical protein n=1 Tax=Planctomicrobium sp. SH661 TaxID=3448124 RepID=UPI003F5B962F